MSSGSHEDGFTSSHSEIHATSPPHDTPVNRPILWAPTISTDVFSLSCVRKYEEIIWVLNP